MKPDQKGMLARAGALVLALVLIVGIAWGLSTLQRLRRHLESAQLAAATGLNYLRPASGGAANAVEILRNPDRLVALQSAMATLDADLAAIENLARPFLPLSGYLGWLPVIGGDIEAAPHLLATSRHAVDAANALNEGISPLITHLVQAEGGVANVVPQMVEDLDDARPHIDSAQASLSLAAQSRAAVEPAQLSPRVQLLLQQFDSYVPPAEKAVVALTILPGLLGADGARSYLLVAQNNQELRATGGFISGVGLVRFEDGRITDLTFQDSYSIDDLAKPHPTPPAPLRRLMGAGMLLMRDANWWPSFPTSAQALTQLYGQDQGQEVDGVIAVDLTALRLLLQALGPIRVPGYDEPVTGDNLQGLIMRYWEAPRISAPGKEGTDWWLHRKDFAADLMSAVLVHLMQQATPEDLVALAQGTGTALGERHLLIYAQEPTSQSLLAETGWDGELRSSQGDYLMVVDSNVGFNKVNPNIQQTIDYSILLDGPNSALATLSLTYRHRVGKPMPACVHESRYGDSYADLMERCYWDYLRVYVPPGSELVDVSGTDGPVHVYEESGRTVIATSFLLETGQARRLLITYRPRIPELASGYSLLVQKQPGTAALPLRVKVTPPSNVSPSVGSPSGWAWLEGGAVWQGLLRQDQELQVTWD